MRIVTRPHFDGIVCAVLLREALIEHGYLLGQADRDPEKPPK
ncbi:MAG: hypothetical protein U5K27_09790 [Desulfotignum sp.]|nr:hypothetical protein [Desulfotignum sp.]